MRIIPHGLVMFSDNLNPYHHQKLSLTDDEYIEFFHQVERIPAIYGTRVLYLTGQTPYIHMLSVIRGRWRELTNDFEMAITKARHAHEYPIYFDNWASALIDEIIVNTRTLQGFYSKIRKILPKLNSKEFTHNELRIVFYEGTLGDYVRRL